MAAQRPSGAPQNGHRNEVHLIGRLASEPVSTTLPSGDVVVSLRVVVDRDRRSRRPPSVDTVDCAAWSASIQRKVMGWAPGDVVAVDGALRRRFWRGPSGPSSRYELEVRTARRVARAA